MKKLSLLILPLLTAPVYAQSILSSLNAYQNTLGASANPQTKKNEPEVKSDGGGSSSNAVKCGSNDQKSMPLSYITGLIMEKDGALDIVHDPRTGNLTVASPKMISNCNDMVEWKLKKPTIQGQQAYAIEAIFRDGDNCSKDKGCTYKVAKMANGSFDKWEEKSFQPTLKGFEECLKQSGVVANGKVVPEAIYPNNLNEKFTGLDQSGKLFLLSNGPMSPVTGAKYGKFEFVNGCDHYEVASQNVKSVLTLDDAEKERLDAEASKLRECKVDEYQKLADFLDKYEGYASELGQVRDKLILEAVKKAAKNLEDNKYTDEDLKVIGDFDRYIVRPKIERAQALYDEMLDLEGDAKKAKQAELTGLLAEIAALDQKPYFIAANTIKLLKDGKFEDAEKLNDVKLLLESYKRLGAKQNNVVITPSVAAANVANGKASFQQTLEKQREVYEYRTGQSSGKADYYTGLGNRMRQNVQTRTQNYTQEIQEEMTRVQAPNGYCYKYWRNTQKCIQETAERIQSLQAEMQYYNQVDSERAGEYDAKAKEYGDLEKEGRRYIAVQNGEPVPQENTTTQNQPQDTTRPQPRPQTQDNGVYNFNYQQPQQQAQMTPNQYQYQTNPYQNNNMFMMQNPYQQQYQGGFMGQQAYGYSPYGYYGNNGGGYSFNYGGGMQAGGYGGYQQYGMGSPYSAAYGGGYSIYGRLWN